MSVFSVSFDLQYDTQYSERYRSFVDEIQKGEYWNETTSFIALNDRGNIALAAVCLRRMRSFSCCSACRIWFLIK